MATLPPFKICPAHFSHAAQTTALSNRAFLAPNHPKLATYLSPRLFEYPQDFATSTLHRHRSRLLNPTMVGLVACVGNEVIGDAFFQRYPLRPRSESLFEILRRWAVTYYQKLYSWVFPDRSTDMERLEAAYKYIEETQKFVEEKVPEWWWVESVAVDPSWWRRGVGRALMAWVMERAREEGVPVILESSHEGKFLYQSMGFKKVREAFHIEGEDAGGMMAWWPEGMSGGEKFEALE
jgi:GNAT superfamily N-acetyltransferase